MYCPKGKVVLSIVEVGKRVGFIPIGVFVSTCWKYGSKRECVCSDWRVGLWMWMWILWVVERGRGGRCRCRCRRRCRCRCRYKEGGGGGVRVSDACIYLFTLCSFTLIYLLSLRRRCPYIKTRSSKTKIEVYRATFS